MSGRSGIAFKHSRRLGPVLQVLEFAEPDLRRFPHAVPDDPLFAGQWNLQNSASTPSAVDAGLACYEPMIDACNLPKLSPAGQRC